MFHAMQRHRRQQRHVMRRPRPVEGEVEQILYDLEALYRTYPRLFTRRPTSEWD